MSIELIVGPMFSGKTKALLRRIRTLEQDSSNILLCITHSDDDRYTTEHRIISHDGDSHVALAARELMPIVSSHLYKNATHLVIEESQFFPDLFPFVKQGADAHHKAFLCGGLDGDYMRGPFGQLMDLVPHCDTIQKLKANCTRCSEPGTAIFTARRRGKSSDQVYIGGKEAYEPMCRRHYIEYGLYTAI
jgi:thymidine kinase